MAAKNDDLDNSFIESLRRPNQSSCHMHHCTSKVADTDESIQLLESPSYEHYSVRETLQGVSSEVPRHLEVDNGSRGRARGTTAATAAVKNHDQSMSTVDARSEPIFDWWPQNRPPKNLLHPPSKEAPHLGPPETQPASKDELVAEAKGVHGGLVTIESKCIEVDNAQRLRDGGRLHNERWPALISVHRKLSHEHHDFFHASQHPTPLHEHHDFFLARQLLSSNPSVPILPLRYAVLANMWRHGMHAVLELPRHRLPASLEYMLTFIHFSYSMMKLLFGRLARPDNLQYLFCYSRSLCSSFANAFAVDGLLWVDKYYPTNLFRHDEIDSYWKIDDDQKTQVALMTEEAILDVICLGSHEAAHNNDQPFAENRHPPISWLDSSVDFSKSLMSHYRQTPQQTVMPYADGYRSWWRSCFSHGRALDVCFPPILHLLGMTLFMGGAAASPISSKTTIVDGEWRTNVNSGPQWSWHLVIFISSFAWVGCYWSFERRRSADAKKYELWFSVAALSYYLAYGYKTFVEKRVDSATSAGFMAIGFTAAWTIRNTQRMGIQQRQLLLIGTTVVVLALDIYLCSKMRSSDPAKSFMALLVPCIGVATFFFWALRIMSTHIAPLLN